MTLSICMERIEGNPQLALHSSLKIYTIRKKWLKRNEIGASSPIIQNLK